MGRPKSINNQLTETSQLAQTPTQSKLPETNIDLTHKAFGMFKDVNGKWMVSEISYNPFDHTQTSFSTRKNFWVPEKQDAGDDPQEAFENFKRFAIEEFFEKE